MGQWTFQQSGNKNCITCKHWDNRAEIDGEPTTCSSVGYCEVKERPTVQGGTCRHHRAKGDK